MLLKEMIMETGIDNILGAFYKHFDEEDEGNYERFMNNLLALLETDYNADSEMEGRLHFTMHKDHTCKHYSLVPHYAEEEQEIYEKFALYFLSSAELLNMQVDKPYFLSDAEAICIIVDDALRVTG